MGASRKGRSRRNRATGGTSAMPPSLAAASSLHLATLSARLRPLVVPTSHALRFVDSRHLGCYAPPAIPLRGGKRDPAHRRRGDFPRSFHPYLFFCCQATPTSSTVGLLGDPRGYVASRRGETPRRNDWHSFSFLRHIHTRIAAALGFDRGCLAPPLGISLPCNCPADCHPFLPVMCDRLLWLMNNPSLRARPM